MIDPQVSLAFALHSNPGAYAALIGSGVSVSAGIPTGWQIVLDLVSRLALVLGEEPGDDPAGWYQERFGEEHDYSKLLDALARSPAERSALLRSYFEPTAEDRVLGLKVPGAAHKALAELAATGFLRLFVTTNFDRLIEQALEDAGVTPRVLSTPDSILGSPPLSQAGCTVVKLHGDYLDTRIKNTPAELDAYHESVDELLDRIIEEHGFIVCGWSAAWDTALRRAFERRKSRRYTTYWADVVPPGAHASHLIELLEGEFIKANVTGTDLVIGAAHEMGLDPIVHVSSFVALIGTKGAILTPDSVPTTPPGAYYRSKADSDRVARGYQENGAPVVITYPGSVWGPNDPHLGESCQNAKAILHRFWTTVPIGGAPIGDVRDVAKLHAAVLEKGRGPRRYFAPSQNATSKSLVRTVSQVTGRWLPCMALPGWTLRWPMRVVDRVQLMSPIRMPFSFQAVYAGALNHKADDSLTRVEFGIEPIPIDQSLADTIRWMYEGNHVSRRLAGDLAT